MKGNLLNFVKDTTLIHFRKCTSILFLFLLVFQSFSQNIDSIEKGLPHLKGREKISALADLCYYTSTSDFSKSVRYGNLALDLAKITGDSLLIASCQNDLAMSYMFQGNNDSCIILAESAYKIRLAKQKWRDAGASLSKAATGYYEKGKYDISLQKNIEAIELFIKAGSFLEASKIQGNIGAIYERNNQLEEAKKMYLESAEAAEKGNDPESYLTARSNYAIVLKKQGRVQEAIEIYTGLLTTTASKAKPEYSSILYQSLGVAERERGNTQKGLAYYLKAREIYEKIGSDNGLSVIDINIGNCYTDLKNFTEAEKYLMQGLTKAKKTKSFLWQKNAYDGLYQLERARGNFKTANEYLENSADMNDSLYNEKTQNLLGELQTKYNLKQKENTILTQKNIIAEKELSISRRNTILTFAGAAFLLLLLFILFMLQLNNVRRKKSEILFQKKIQRERARISKDLHDNMGAELTIISSAIDLKAYATEKQKDKDDLEAISDQVRKASALMRDTIWTVSEEKISVSQFGIKIKEFAERTFKHKNIHVHFVNSESEMNLRPESTLNLFRMVQEVINNAAKHSGAKNFYIENFPDHQNKIILRDDGTGYNADTVDRGYGLNNIVNRAKDINATVITQSKPGKGTRVEINIEKESLWFSEA